MVLTVRMVITGFLRMIRWALSPTICVGALYLPLPRWAWGHVSACLGFLVFLGFLLLPEFLGALRFLGPRGFLWFLGLQGPPRVCGFRMVSRVRNVTKGRMVSTVCSAPSSTIYGGFVY